VNEVFKQVAQLSSRRLVAVLAATVVLRLRVARRVGRAALDSNFASIGDVVHRAASNTILATWYVGGMPEGDYILRLTAVDKQAQYPRPCDVHIKVKH
jgi:hypothetical protein